MDILQRNQTKFVSGGSDFSIKHSPNGLTFSIGPFSSFYMEISTGGAPKGIVFTDQFPIDLKGNTLPGNVTDGFCYEGFKVDVTGSELGVRYFVAPGGC